MIRKLACLAAALVLTACGQGGESQQGAAAARTINFSILATENSQTQQAEWAPFFRDMEATTGLKVRPIFQSNYTGLIEAMRFKQADVGWFSNQSGLEAVRRANGEVFARSSDPSGVDGYNAVVVVNTDKGTTLEDITRCDRSLSFGMGDAKSTSGTLAPMTFLFAPRSIDPQRCFRTVRAANHESNLLSVANGLLDAATNNTTSLRFLRERRPELAAKLRVVWTSPRLPEDPLVWRKDLDPEVKEKIRQFVLTYGTGEGPEAATQRQNLERLSFGVFQPADNSHLLPVREMEATEQMLTAQQAGDQAAVTKARQELESIRAQRAEIEARAGVAPTN
jgi:phosphonate transport system substrate-binding protein